MWSTFNCNPIYLLATWQNNYVDGTTPKNTLKNGRHLAKSASGFSPRTEGPRVVCARPSTVTEEPLRTERRQPKRGTRSSSHPPTLKSMSCSVPAPLLCQLRSLCFGFPRTRLLSQLRCNAQPDQTCASETLPLRPLSLVVLPNPRDTDCHKKSRPHISRRNNIARTFSSFSVIRTNNTPFFTVTPPLLEHILVVILLYVQCTDQRRRIVGGPHSNESQIQWQLNSGPIGL